MLPDLDRALEAALRDRLQVNATDEAGFRFDVEFDTPDDDWRGRLQGPTLNLFLWDIRRSADESRAGRELVERDGVELWRMRPPRIEFQYLLTVWTNDVEDEHELLGRCLAAILGTPTLDGEHRPEFVRDGDPAPTVRVARTDGKDLAEFWGAIDGRLKPGLNLIVSASVDPELAVPAGARTRGVGTTVRDVDGDRSSSRDHVAGRIVHPDADGAIVITPRGTTTVRPDGTFLVAAQVGDLVTVDVDDGLTTRVRERAPIELP